VNSDFSPEEMATTTSGGCAQPIIETAGFGPFTLSLATAYDSYLWSTGETTSSIVIDPPSEQWYWARVTSAGECTEAAAKLVFRGESIFSDGFESGDISAWSLSEPPPCSHDPCHPGSSLNPMCHPCVGKICAVDGFCCTTLWDRACVDLVPSICGLACD
jgi:hypothetical protein